MKEITTTIDGARFDYWLLDNGDTMTTTGQFIMNTIMKLCHKAGLDKIETGLYEQAVYRAIENVPEIWDIETGVKCNL